MIPVVLDTSVLIAGLLSPRGAAALLVSAFFGDSLKLIYTPEIIAEFAEVMARPEFAEVITPADRMAVLLKVRASGVLVIPAAVPADAWPDPDDLPFVAAALASRDKIIVTLNPADFAPAVAHGVNVMSPSDARQILF